MPFGIPLPHSSEWYSAIKNMCTGFKARLKNHLKLNDKHLDGHWQFLCEVQCPRASGGSLSAIGDIVGRTDRTTLPAVANSDPLQITAIKRAGQRGK
jgi:hypothetical protein